jgi:hypothetical protein
MDRVFDDSERMILMKTWLTSRNGALILSFAALLTLLARSYYDTRFILTEEFSPLMPGMDTIWIFAFTAIVGINMAFLLAAAVNGDRGAWIGLLVFNLLTGLGAGAGSLLAYTSNTLEFVIFTASLAIGILAAVAVVPQLSKRKADFLGMAG